MPAMQDVEAAVGKDQRARQARNAPGQFGRCAEFALE
jgi:hypothetical protein